MHFGWFLLVVFGLGFSPGRFEQYKALNIKKAIKVFQ